MVDINWAKENCTENKEKQDQINEAMKWLEGYIDKGIKEACYKGRSQYIVSPDHEAPRELRLYDEVINNVVDKYLDAGYSVSLKVDHGYNIISIGW